MLFDARQYAIIREKYGMGIESTQLFKNLLQMIITNINWLRRISADASANIRRLKQLVHKRLTGEYAKCFWKRKAVAPEQINVEFLQSLVTYIGRFVELGDKFGERIST